MTVIGRSTPKFVTKELIGGNAPYKVYIFPATGFVYMGENTSCCGLPALICA